MKATILILICACVTNCGSDQIETRIVGGNYAVAGQFPFQAAILYKSQFLCTGSILNENYILTAAHCVFNGLQV